MSTRSIHGTDCFEVEAFIVRNEESKLFKVRHKTSGNFYVMEVASRKENSHGLINTNLQETHYNLSKFWVNMKFAFQTSSKSYYILDYIGDRTLGLLYGRHGPLAEVVVQFYASEILNALEELHSHGCFYGDLGLDNVYVDNTGHVVLWRNFCGKMYWTREECVCNLFRYTNGRHCKGNHGKCLEQDLKIDFQLLGLVILQMLSKEHYRIVSSDKTSTQEGLSRIASSLILPSSLSVFSRDLITRLLKGQFYNASHIKTHPFFIGINWKMIQARLTSPPTIAKTSFHPPALRKTSSEACLYVETNISSSPPYARPLTPGTPSNYTNDLYTKTDQNIPKHPPGSTLYKLSQPSTRPAPPPRLRSALSSPDLSMLGREPASRWIQEPVEVESSYHDYHFQPLAASRHVSQSLADLQSINHPRTSSFSTTINRNVITLSDSPRKISQHLSYPPGNRPLFERQYNYNCESSKHSGVYDSSYSSLYKGPSINVYDQYSINNADHHYRKESQHNYTRPSEFRQVISNDAARPFRENLSSLHRAHSCSELNCEDKNGFGFMADNGPKPISRPMTPSIENTERRKYYPLAQVPIPSFAEFKRKNTSTDNKNEQKEIESTNPISAITKSLHQTTIRDDKDSKTILKERDLKKESKKETNTETKQRNGESMKDNYSHNDVIHNLMLKYGLYERSEKRRETRNSPTKTDKESKIASRVETFLESWKKKENSKNNHVISKREESSSSPRKEGRTNRGTPTMRRRASAAVVEQPNIAAPKLTRKSKSTLASDSLDKKEDINNNPTTPPAVENGLSPRSNSILESRYKELASSKTDLTSIADVYKTTRRASEYSMSSSPENTSISMDAADEKGGPTSKTLWEAAKTKLKLGKSPNGSPLVKRKTKEQSSKDILGSISNEGYGKTDVKDEPKRKRSSRSAKEQVDGNIPRRISLEPSPQGQLQKGGIHTSLLSIASSIYSTDNELDDTSSLQSEGRSCERRRRWESFHSNISADSGSAQMFEFESDSLAVEDPFDDREPDEPMRQRSDTEIERTDSGIGGDIIAGRSKRQSWEDIVHKSSRHWSIVAASALHWKEIALKSKLAKEASAARRKGVTPAAISEDMKECPDCQKYHIPCSETSDRSTETFRKNTTTICLKCCERRVERKEAIIELVQTEINYANDLQILKEEFYSPLQTGGILQPDNLSEIFLNFQELVEVSTKFSNRLQYSLEESVSKGNEEFSQVNVGNIFMESVDFFQSYEIYCTKQNAASALLESLQKKNELLKIFLNVTCRENPKCRKMDLNSFLLAPVQRIMKYPLLLSRIRKATPRRNPDREKLMQAQRKIEDQLNRINSLNSTVESKQKRYRGSGQLGRSDSLDKLQMKKMASEILNWTMGEMTLLMHGVFEVVIHDFISASGWTGRRGSKRTLDVFMLFCVLGLSEPKVIDSDEDTTIDEPLFPSDPEATDAALVMLKKKMNGKYTLFKEPISLDSCIVCKHSDHKDCFEIINMARETYVFKAASIKQSKVWLKHLRLQAKDLGAWKKRRNGLPNIMIKTI